MRIRCGNRFIDVNNNPFDPDAVMRALTNYPGRLELDAGPADFNANSGAWIPVENLESSEITFRNVDSVPDIPRATYSDGFQYTVCVPATDTCAKCGHPVKERQLFTGTFVGCMC